MVNSYSFGEQKEVSRRRKPKLLITEFLPIVTTLALLPKSFRGFITFLFLDFFFFGQGPFFKSLLNLLTIFLLPLLFFSVLGFWPRGMWNLSSPTRDQTCIPCIGRQNLNHWTPKPLCLFSVQYSLLSIFSRGEKNVRCSPRPASLLITHG